LMRYETDNCYWRLGATKLKRYALPNSKTWHVLLNGHSPKQKTPPLLRVVGFEGFLNPQTG
jgi:hypothetical protein